MMICDAVVVRVATVDAKSRRESGVGDERRGRADAVVGGRVIDDALERLEALENTSSVAKSS